LRFETRSALIASWTSAASTFGSAIVQSETWKPSSVPIWLWCASIIFLRDVVDQRRFLAPPFASSRYPLFATYFSPRHTSFRQGALVPRQYSLAAAHAACRVLNEITQPR
jgi:hypothetical protein